MRRGYWIALVGLLVCGLGSGNWGCNGDRSDKGPQTYYVAPTGNDQADGSAERPFATLARAVEASRQVAVAQPSRARRIVLRGGEYFGVSVALTGKDSGLSIEAAAGETPVLYGGVPLTGWQKDGEQFYAAKLPEGDAFAGGVRMLEVDGQMCPRARYPEQGTLTHLSTFDGNWRSASEGGWERKPTDEELTTMKYRPEDLGPWLELQNAEVNVYHRWDDSCVGVASLDAEKHLLHFSSACGYPPGAFEVQKYVVWNIREGMRRPGQWYHDRPRTGGQGRIVYWPLPGQDMSRAKVIVPTAETVINLEGTAAEPVRNITLRGLTIHVTTVPLQAAGFAARRHPGAVMLEQAQDCLLDGLTISRVCGQGIRALRRWHAQPAGVTRLRVENCMVGPCGAGGIYGGGEDQIVSNNLVQQVGLFYPSAMGIQGDGHRNRISHNEVHDCSYTGISAGGEENLVEGNLIYDCMKTLEDGAAIYLAGGKKNVLRGNLARDISDHFSASAYYLDENCEDCLVEKNVALRVKVASLNHMAKRNVLRNNVFIAPGGDLEVSLPRSVEHTLERNILWAKGTIRFTQISGVETWHGNLLHSDAGQIEGTVLDMYRVKGKVPGVVGDTRMGDPLFMDAEKGDYRFKPGSPALELGIEPVDVSTAGRVK